jgi:hypothetical protein
VGREREKERERMRELERKYFPHHHFKSKYNLLSAFTFVI